MKFTKLRLLGFKSFVEPMEFVIEDGLTGVVGPNGCGKSNLVEAMRWVMGENSYKNMRASGMDDVIFSGSLNRPARNTAEVTLFLDNSDRTAPQGFNDADMLEISRRIEREAGSLYRINAKDVRARDVQLLFADASTGARSNALVGQGRIGELIAAKPTSRRKILEEAAGISGLHSRRHEAELRLRAAEQNLERLEDVLVQIDGQLEGLKRQARQASRYRNLSGEIRKAEAAILYLRWLEAGEALKAAEAELATVMASVNEAATAQAASAREQAIAAHQVPDLRDAAARAGAALQRLVIARNELDAEDRRIRERLRDLDQRRQQLAQDLDREQRMGSENAELLAALDEEERALNSENEMVAERAQEVADRVAKAEEKLQASEGVLSRKTEENAQFMARRAQAERTLSDARQRLDRFKVQAGEVARDLSALREEIASRTDVADHRAALEQAEAALEEAGMRAEVTEIATSEARSAEAAAREPLADAERRLGADEAEARALASLLASAAEGDWVPLIDAVEVSPGYEAALGAAFGDDLDAPADPAAPVRWSESQTVADDPALPDGVEALAAQVRAPAVLSRRLAQIGLVDRADAVRLLPQLKPGQRLVSREGDLWRWDGYIATAEAPTAAAQRLAQRNRLAELEARIEELAGEVEARRWDLERHKTAVAVAVEAEQAARNAAREGQRRVDQTRVALSEAERALSALSVRRASLEEAEARLAGQMEDAQTELAEAEEISAELSDTSALEAEIARLREEVASDRAILAEARAAASGLERENDMRRRRLDGIARERRSWQERAANAERQLTILRERQEEAVAEITELTERPAEIEEQRRALISEVAKAEEARSQTDDALLRAERTLGDADRTAREALEALASAREGKVRAEERVESARGRAADVAERIADALEVTPQEVPAVAELRDGAPLPDVRATESRLERLKAERERLGGVNLRAEEEVEEISTQRDSLVSDRDDLIEAIRRLRTGISNLNREARERLLTSFEVVNDHFQRLFTHLFGGGTAELQLIESDDPLEAGLEIVARPPGKKPQTMTLLSGGEQALTAMALIFAVFLTNPAPICVLDEVDAPLDDANVERYCDLLEEMARLTQTRFVVITHNPITMSRMNRLFGVTMAERGVSQLVSVDLEMAERFLEAV
ncbi:condensin subunit Smc [Breoghania corrubedonensis]|uniref:Chromosome partition protein Smc n=1 Tax=Breoghania corrubedonensis TaxID=665038 RepID=A0A2T5VEP7_9HYPH|nr:chromosome segregation protein SMC [Breoghania corrubedonensis]PTW62232.1 condensin subunit Smc [Breoghania corrubedonensis]